MNDCRALVIWGKEGERRDLRRLLLASGAQVEESASVPDRVCEQDLILLDYDLMPEATLDALRSLSGKPRQPAVVVFSQNSDKAALVKLFEHDSLTGLIFKTNLIADSRELEATDLAVTVQKIIQGDIFGLEKYLGWGAKQFECVMTSTRQKSRILGEIEGFLCHIGCNQQLIEQLRASADELLMNAAFSAPAGADGRPKYDSDSRSNPLDLAAGEEVVLRYACDGRRMAVSVRDKFGRLDGATVLGYLRRCFKMGGYEPKAEGGAGLGLYEVFESVNSLVINVDPGKMTEMIGLLRVAGSFRNFSTSPKSLHVFHKRSDEDDRRF